VTAEKMSARDDFLDVHQSNGITGTLISNDPGGEAVADKFSVTVSLLSRPCELPFILFKSSTSASSVFLARFSWHASQV